jgi:GTP cyclohydrolase I
MNRNDHEELDLFTTIDIKRREIPQEKMRKFEGYAAEIFSAFGMDLNTPATKDTPRRFIQALFDATEGYDGDP